jgi:glycyl-tRNA synthetase (class II)
MENTLEQLVNYAKQYGFVFQGSEIYGGLANTWDYGPLGVELKNNIKKAWWDQFVRTNPYNVGLDTAIILNPETWVASGHVGGFQDPLMDCKNCVRIRDAVLLCNQCRADLELGRLVRAMPDGCALHIEKEEAADTWPWFTVVWGQMGKCAKTPEEALKALKGE